jgi:hypothetical protein
MPEPTIKMRKIGGKKMSNREAIINFLKDKKEKQYCDDCLSEPAFDIEQMFDILAL